MTKLRGTTIFLLLTFIIFNCNSIVMAGKDDITKTPEESVSLQTAEKKRVFISDSKLPLLSAISTKNFEKAKSLILMERGLYELDCNLDGPLHYASRIGNLELTKLLIQKGLYVDIEDVYQRTPLALSIDEEVSQFLIEAGASKNFVEVNQRDAKCDPLLKTAVLNNDLETAQNLIRRGARPNIIDRKKRTPLCYCKSIEMAKLLIKNGAKMEYTDPNGEGPLECAIEHDDIDLLKFFIEQKGGHLKLNFVEAQCLVVACAENGRIGILSYLMDDLHMFMWNTEFLMGELLCGAVKYNQMNMLNFLLSKKVSINARNFEGNTALHIAILRKNANMAKFLIDRNIDVDAKNYFGKTASDLISGRSFIEKLSIKGVLKVAP